MEWGSTLLNLFFVAVLVFFNGFFVATEFSIVKVRESRITQLVAEGNLRASRVEQVIQDLDAYLSACQLGITLASLGLGWLGEPAVADLLHPVFVYFGVPEPWVSSISFIIAFSAITFLHIVLGELAPKTFAIQKTEWVAMMVAGPIQLFHKIMYPFIAFLNWSAVRFLALFHLNLEPHQEAHTEEEIRILVEESHKSGLIDQTELMLVDNIFDFSETMAREIMVPRTDMVVLDLEDSFEENVKLVREGRYTRYPVVEGDKDHVLGTLHIKDLFNGLQEGEAKDIKKMMRPVLTVPETISISRLFTMLQKQRGQIAIIIDEYGGTAGLVTLEDIMEEIVGDRQDEFDDERPEVEKNNDSLSLDGRILLEEVNDYLDVDLESSDVDTLAGWIYTQLDHPPEVGDVITFEQYQFIVAEVDHYRITRVRVKKVNDAEAEKSEP